MQGRGQPAVAAGISAGGWGSERHRAAPVGQHRCKPFLAAQLCHPLVGCSGMLHGSRPAPRSILSCEKTKSWGAQTLAGTDDRGAGPESPEARMSAGSGEMQGAVLAL